MNNRLRNARNDRRWSIDEAAKRIGVSRTTYIRWEKGTQFPHGSTLNMACDAFKMTPELLGFKDLVGFRADVEQVEKIPYLFVEAPAYTTHLFQLGIQALTLAQQQYNWTFDELRWKAEQEMKKLDRENRSLDVTTTRRQALRFLVGLPVAMLGLTQNGSASHPLDAEEILPLYISSVPACWKLYFDGELAEVERVLPMYIEHLAPLSQHVSIYQKHAAGLLSQAHQLAAETVLQREDFGTSLAHCKQAATYAHIAEDPNVYVAALLRQINTLFYRNRPTAQTIQEAMQHAQHVSPLLRGRIYSEYAANIASYTDRKQDVLRYIGLAHDTFPEMPEEDPGYLYTHTTKYILFFNDTLAYLKQGKAEDAWQAIIKAGTFVSNAISPRRMELLKYQLLSSFALEDLDRSCLFFEELTASATTLGSDLWMSDLSTIYSQLHTKWPHERKIKSMEELLH